MLGGAGLKGRSAIARQSFAAFSPSTRSISTARLQPFSKLPVRNAGLSRPLARNPLWKPAFPISGVSTARFNSSSSAAGNAADQASQTPAADTSTLPDIGLDDIYNLPEGIGYLKQLGLDYGWGPSSMIEFCIEHFHIWGGLPWWGSIVATGLLIRFLLLKPMVDASDNAIKMKNVKHLTDPLYQDMQRFSKEGDNAAVMKLSAELKHIRDTHGVSFVKGFVPMLQLPLGFGCYRVVEGMAKLPVPGLAQESLLWLKDLTVADPYFILPAASAAFMYLTLKRGGETATSDIMTGQFGKTFRTFLVGLSFAFVMTFPAALQLYFAATGLFACAQSYLVWTPPVRRFLGMTELSETAKADASASAAKRLRMIESVQEKVEMDRRAAGQQKGVEEANNSRGLSGLIKSYQEYKASVSKEMKEKMANMTGEGPSTNPDGSPKAAPRLTEKDRNLAADYEKRRREEEEWSREERNRARRDDHWQTLERERQKARSMYKR